MQELYVYIHIVKVIFENVQIAKKVHNVKWSLKSVHNGKKTFKKYTTLKKGRKNAQFENIHDE